ncbi:Na+:H+ antiporter, NhaA family [Candidatus Planktophila dulcis]|uniref:Na+:H+ antiporter, NhaA family n=1 Tax=Candidatus Planktophila dulcis TaxID=1884914 RepID=A0AAC9YVS6_9ACTN|nr:Na+/H+ antiporter NhaA [Candidatus Planktophila dulcis]ASY12134.1 Na+:H+ antiporter, NhaA family [Candidatus Planktophila dulcis]
MLSEVLTFIFFILIGLEIREGLNKPKDAILPALAALGGMLLPALIFIALIPGSRAWAIAMPTDVALAIGALSILGKRVNPAVRLFLLTLAVADDFFSLLVIGIFFRDDLHLASATYTLGAAAIGFLLPFRHRLISLLSPIATFLIIPIYIFINLLSKLDFSVATEKISIAVVLARVIGKVLGITLFAFLFTRFTNLKLPQALDLKEIVGVGFLAGMGLTVSIVIAEITLKTESELAQVRMGLFFAAILSGLLGVLWLKRFPASL